MRRRGSLGLPSWLSFSNLNFIVSGVASYAEVGTTLLSAICFNDLGLTATVNLTIIVENAHGQGARTLLLLPVYSCLCTPPLWFRSLATTLP